MSRPIPHSPSTQIDSIGADEPLLDVTVHVVTPIFGGSAEPGRVDPLHPVRGSSVRGHLRFWWRACRAAAFPNTAKLFQKESEVWGSTDDPAAVLLEVAIVSRGKGVPCATYPRRRDGAYQSMPQWRQGYPGYALFPFGGKAGRTGIQEEPATALEGVSFRLVLRAAYRRFGDAAAADAWRNELRREVEAAVWAWIAFGGVGARTRRGCGALYCQDPRFHPSGDVKTWLEEQAGIHVSHGDGNPLLPRLHNASALWGPRNTCMAAWSAAVDLMRDFRQKPDFARNPGDGGGRPGRSRWPEPDSIRLASGGDPKHQPLHEAAPFYPRADLGLPIVFHFQRQDAPRDPSDHTLEANGSAATRMASPIILKPLALSQTSAVPLVLLLSAPHVWHPEAPGVVLKRNGQPVDGRLAPNELHSKEKADAVPPLSCMGQAFARNAFMRYALKQWPKGGGGVTFK